MRELLIKRIKYLTKDASYGSLRWAYLYDELNEKRNISTKVLKQTKLFDMFDFDTYSNNLLLDYYETVVRKANTQM